MKKKERVLFKEKTPEEQEVLLNNVHEIYAISKDMFEQMEPEKIEEMLQGFSISYVKEWQEMSSSMHLELFTLFKILKLIRLLYNLK